MKKNYLEFSMGNIWKKYGRRMVAGVSAATMIAGQTSAFNLVHAEDSGSAMGRYLEYEVILPEDLISIYNLATMENGRIRMFAETVDAATEMSSPSLWDSKDGGASWELVTAPSELLGVGFVATALCEDGSGAAISFSISWGEPSELEEYDTGEETKKETQSTEYTDISVEAIPVDEGNLTFSYSLISFDETGVTSQAPLDGTYDGELFFSGDGSLFYHDKQNVYQLDPATGEFVMEYPADSVAAAAAYGTELLILTDENVLLYDITTGDALGEDTVLAEALLSREISSDVSTSGSSNLAMTEDTDGRLFFATSSGIYTYLSGGSVVEQIVDGSLNSLSSPVCELVWRAVIDDAFYLISHRTDVDTDCDKILKYEYSAETASVPEHELKIWSLEENAGIRQSIRLYQDANPDTSITYEVGLSEDDDVTVSDAIQTLNSEISAGNGPDILILDGLSVDTYSSQGLLMDLSDLMAEIQEKEGFLENIAYTYQDADGVWAVPLQFDIPVLVGYTDSVEQVDGISSLTDFAQEGAYNVQGAAELLYEVCAGSWIQEDGVINQELLSEYIQTIIQLADINTSTEGTAEDSGDASYDTENDIDNNAADDTDNDTTDDLISNAAEYLTGEADDTLESASLNFIDGTITLATANLSGMLDYISYSSVSHELGDITLCTLTGQQENVFIPMGTIGILSTSQNADAAEAFVSYLLSADVQLSLANSLLPEDRYSSQPKYGWPVNTAAFSSLLYENTYEDGCLVIGTADGVLAYSWPTDEELEWLMETALSLNVRSDQDAVKKEIVMKELKRVLTGESSEGETVNTIVEKISQYLSK
ncbi:MAG: ABC transporter substrate-binding protein [Lachnospiraceae bacterium]|nr:ABC transporter substrate-binding protein [Lachnospiraceae bacterium]